MNDKYDPAEKFKGTTDEKTLKNALEFLKKLKEKEKKNVDSSK